MERSDIDISVVICFRDWGLDRLVAAVRSHHRNALDAGINLEIIVSDYGSKDPRAVAEAMDLPGCLVVHTEARGPWNRSASLNAGIRAARGRWIVTTDADIVFMPDTLPELMRLAELNENALYLIQCRDLPEGYGAERIAQLLDEKSWQAGVHQAWTRSAIRPRWGMGGFAAFTAQAVTRVNGYEGRMKIWGGEDNDFALRMRRAGMPVRWLSRPGVGILHIWHEPSQRVAIQTEEGKAAVDENRRILREDVRTVRNLPASMRPCGQSTDPLVTIIIPTFQRGELLRQAIRSCVEQTYQDWNLLVVENGESYEARTVVESFKDARIHYLKSPLPGAAAARNFGLKHTSSRYIVIHDDDDVMVSTRVEDHLNALRAGDCGTYSGWIDFESDTFEATDFHPGKEFSFEAVLCNGKVLTHGSLMLDRAIFNRFSYAEDLSAGIDYGFLLLLARNGLRLSHTGKYGILRRMHESNMTRLNSGVQKSAAVKMAAIIKSEYSEAEYKDIRASGMAAEVLDCGNREASLNELNELSEKASPVLLGVKEVGDTLTSAIDAADLIGRKVCEARSNNKVVRVAPDGLSVGALIYTKLRTAARAFRAGV